MTDFLKRLLCRIGESIRKNWKKWQEFLNRIKDKLTGKKAGQPAAVGAACSVSFDKVKPCAAPPGGQPAKPCNGNCFRPTTLVAGPHNKIPIGKRWPGQWVYTVQRSETERLSGPPTEVDPETWRLLRLSLNKYDGTAVGIVLLRPISWILETNARAGKTINLDLNELGAAGEATVLTIEPCPEIEPFPADLIPEADSYRLITGLFTHTSGEVYDLRVKGEPEPLCHRANQNQPVAGEIRAAWVGGGS